MFESALTWLHEQRHEYLTVEVTYTRVRTGTESLISATVGHTLFRVTDEYGRYIAVRSRDYIVRASDLFENGEQFFPEVGDIITENEHVNKVLSVAGEPHYRWAGPSSENFRIHTKGQN